MFMEIQKIMSKYKLLFKNRIDLAGPDGNVFNLIGIGRKILLEVDAGKDEIIQFSNEMCESDYEHALNVFKNWFGDSILYNSNED
jgi:hypothetical protein